MKRITLILLLGLCACKSGFDSYSKKCVDKKDREILKKAVELFELKIEEHYPELSIEEGYFEFINDWENKKLPIEFFQDSLELEIRSLDLWTESKRSEKLMDLEKKLFNVDSMNPIRVKLKTEFSICLSKTTQRDGIRSFLILNSKYRISPKIASKSLTKSNIVELKKFENRLTIVLGVYYQTLYNIKNTVANSANKNGEISC